MTSLTVATVMLSTAASHMCLFSCRTLTLFPLHILLENSSLVNNLYQTIFQEYHWMDTGLPETFILKYWEKCVCWCLLACLFIYSFVYLLFGSGSINYWKLQFLLHQLVFHFRFFSWRNLFLVIRDEKEFQTIPKNENSCGTTTPTEESSCVL